MKVSFTVEAREYPGTDKYLFISVFINDRISLSSNIPDNGDLKSLIPKMVEKAKELYLRSNEVEQILNGAV